MNPNGLKYTALEDTKPIKLEDDAKVPLLPTPPDNPTPMVYQDYHVADWSPPVLREILERAETANPGPRYMVLDRPDHVLVTDTTPASDFLSYGCRQPYSELSIQLSWHMYRLNLDRLAVFKSSIWVNWTMLSLFAALPNLQVLSTACDGMASGYADQYLCGEVEFERLAHLTIRFKTVDEEVLSFFSRMKAQYLKTLLIQISGSSIYSDAGATALLDIIRRTACYPQLDLFCLRDGCREQLLTGKDKGNLEQLLTHPVTSKLSLIPDSPYDKSQLGILAVKRPSLRVDGVAYDEVIRAFPRLRLLQLDF
ncbi:hypothetical protein EIP86_006636 [Pleurotus ostreatoroseus]|nr:hypothetical protein EIP86_006636 [Pleurotus ostreatoroseus]